MSASVRPRRSVLYMPGANTRALEKARTLPADALIFDLEDAVAPAAKIEARGRIVQALLEGGWRAPTVTVRVNDWTTSWTYGDVAEVVGAAGRHIDALVLPKCASASQVQALDLLLTQVEHTAGLPIGRIGLELYTQTQIGEIGEG